MYSGVPEEHEAEKASNSYIMSLLAVVAGMPFPIINLAATFFFFLSNRKSTFFVRWHCTQALVSQFFLFLINTAGFWWTMIIIFTPRNISNLYISYVLTILLYNIGDLAATIYSAVGTRKGRHIEWWFYGNLTDLICRAK